MTAKNIHIEKLKDAELEITAEIPPEEFEAFREDAVKEIGGRVNVPGFRNGKVPENVLIKNVGEMAILEEMAERAIGKAYPKILVENKINAIGRPQVTITKIARGEALGFKVIAATMPDITIGDYKKIAKEKMSAAEGEASADDAEVENVITQIRKQQAHTIKSDEKSSGKPESKDNGSEKKKGKSKDDRPADGKEKTGKQESKEAGEADLPELTDDFVKTLGNFKDVADLREKIKENIIKEKEMKARQKKRMDIMDAVLTESDIEIPNIVVESELENMMAQFEGDIARMGLKFEEYLKHIKKTREDLKKEWRTDAERNSKIQLILNKIAVLEDIKADNEKTEEEVKRLLEHYKNSPGGVSESRARDYVENILTNEAVFEFLENQK